VRTTDHDIVSFNIISFLCFIFSLLSIRYIGSEGGGRDLPLHLGAPLAVFSLVAIIIHVRMNKILKDDNPSNIFNKIMPSFSFYMAFAFFLPGYIENDILSLCLIITSTYHAVSSIVEYRKQ
jgi:hypothetical protein